MLYNKFGGELQTNLSHSIMYAYLSNAFFLFCSDINVICESCTKAVFPKPE